ncbi:hypothetical protein HPB51_025730 [Rhipicephalus microplus]|uniref:PiggyBac transposable element-derived protein domain-containing protein n=1 Tax=Rhipicephalus microplus TaxID=6941 RepID=A0A9J6F9U2_RHIMP|nr:hypothetical protein HPB51_025730 [Rhipicephalus microplus]
MGGVHVCDQLLEYYRISIKTKKWTLKVSLHMVDLSIVNAWMQYREDCRRNGAQRRDTMDLLQFHLAIGEALCASLTRSRSDNSESLCLPDVHVDKAIRVAKISGVDIHIDGFDHFPTVSLQFVRKALELDGCSVTLQAMHGITGSHTNPNNFEKMRVSLAFQLFGEKVIHGLQLYKSGIEDTCGDITATLKFFK